MTQHAERHAQLGVASDAFNTKVTLTSGGDKAEVLWIGNASGGRRTSLRIGDSDQVYAAEGVRVGDWSSRLSQWVDTKLFEGESDHIREFRVTKSDGRAFVFSKSEGRWTVSKNGSLLTPPKGKELDASLVSGMASTLMNLRLTEPADPESTVSVDTEVEFMFDAPPKKDQDSVLESVAAPTIQFKIGQDDESRRLIHRSDAKPLVWVASPALEKVTTVDVSMLWRDEPKEGSDDSASAGTMPTQLPAGMKLPPGM